MMLCSVCGRSYEASTLFCTADGTRLVDAAPVGPPPSASGELDRLLAELPPDTLPHTPPVAAPAPARTGGLVAVVAVLGVLVVGLVGFVMWQQAQTSDAAVARAEQAEQRAADAQRTADAATNSAADAAYQVRSATEQMQTAGGGPGDGATVWANSPNDGFLALRSGPTTSSGTRLLRIPHGDALVIGGCNPPTTSPGGRTGSWCRAVYDGTAGWVFDAFVSRS